MDKAGLEEPRSVKLEIEVTSETPRDLGMLIIEKGGSYRPGRLKRKVTTSKL